LDRQAWLSLGFYLGAFWSLMLSLTEFLGGIFIALGFLMHPASLAATFVLLVAVWFHWITRRSRLFRCGEVYPVSRDLFLLHHPWWQPPFGRCEDWSSVLNKGDVIMLTGAGRGAFGVSRRSARSHNGSFKQLGIAS
jgi:uncharacterized membrane protein YphA (DoxX/SURF4 family)